MNNIYKLRLYQQEALDTTEALIAFGSTNIILSAATSWGKSTYIAGLCKLYSDRSILIMVTLEPLIDQIAETLFKMNIDYSILKAGREKDFDDNKNIHIVMAQTYYSRVEKMNLKCDILIIDEIHIAYDTKRTQLIKENLEPEIIIGTTATNYNSQGFKLPGSETIETATGKSLTDDGYLTPLKYYTTQWSEKIDYSSVKKHGNDYTTSSLDEIINSPKHIKLITGSMNQMNAKDKKTLVFCSSIAQADHIAEALIKNGYSAIAYHSGKSKQQNKRVLESFKNNTIFEGTDSYLKEKDLFNTDSEPKIKKPITCLVSINKLAVGFDVPEIQLGVILRPSKIRSLMSQVIGRQKRLAPGKKYAEILDLAQTIRHHGFVDTDPYDPPEQTDDKELNKQLIQKATEPLALENLEITLTEELEEITREKYEIKIQEIKDNKSKLSNMTTQELNKKLQLEEDPVVIISIIIILFDKIHNELMPNRWGQESRGYIASNNKPVVDFVNSGSIGWIAEDWIELLPKQGEYNQTRYIKSLRTRGRNLLKQKGSIWGLKYFLKWLIKEDKEKEESTEIYNNYDFNIAEEDIPY